MEDIMRMWLLALGLLVVSLISFGGHSAFVKETALQQVAAAPSSHQITDGSKLLKVLLQNNTTLPQSSSILAAYSFCGACTSHSDCGTGNRCCTGNCSNNKKKCYKVSQC
jgi:hypothetical protein